MNSKGQTGSVIVISVVLHASLVPLFVKSFLGDVMCRGSVAASYVAEYSGLSPPLKGESPMRHLYCFSLSPVVHR